MNPWPIVGGVAMSARTEDQFIRPTHAMPGNVLVLTKALGTQVAVNAYEWCRRDRTKWNRLTGLITCEEATRAYTTATDMMCRLNRTAASLMHTYHATSATDVTGFGILGHLQNMAASQVAEVDFELTMLPILNHMANVDQALGGMFKLIQGYSAETSGGLLVALPQEHAQAYIDDMVKLDGQPAWIVGKVVAGTRQARLSPDLVLLDV